MIQLSSGVSPPSPFFSKHAPRTAKENAPQKHHDKEAPLVTFHTMKAREAQHSGAKEEHKALKARKAARRHTAHTERVKRYTKRLNGGTATS